MQKLDAFGLNELDLAMGIPMLILHACVIRARAMRHISAEATFEILIHLLSYARRGMDTQWRKLGMHYVG